MMNRFELVNEVVMVDGAELLLVMIERAEDATLIHWRLPSSCLGQRVGVPRLDLCGDASTPSIAALFRNIGGSGMENHMVDVYRGVDASKIVLTETDGGRVVYARGA